MASRKPAQKATRKGRTELTEEQRQEIKEAFDLFDTDGSGLELFKISNTYQLNKQQVESMPKNSK